MMDEARYIADKLMPRGGVLDHFERIHGPGRAFEKGLLLPDVYASAFGELVVVWPTEHERWANWEVHAARVFPGTNGSARPEAFIMVQSITGHLADEPSARRHAIASTIRDMRHALRRGAR